MTYLWQEEKGKNVCRIQTDEKRIADVLKRRNKFTLVANSLNENLWIFSCEFSRSDIAKKTLKSITGKKVKIDSERVFCYG